VLIVRHNSLSVPQIDASEFCRSLTSIPVASSPNASSSIASTSA
jgi:hypothetical protein